MRLILSPERRRGPIKWGGCLPIWAERCRFSEIRQLNNGLVTDGAKIADMINRGATGNWAEPGRVAALWVPVIHPCWSGCMSVFVEGAAEPASSADIEVRNLLRVSHRFGSGRRSAAARRVRWGGCRL
jgi:hypothetical protein